MVAYPPTFLDFEILRGASRVYGSLAAAQAALRSGLGEELQAAGWVFGSSEYTILRVLSSVSSGAAIAGLAEHLAIPRTTARRTLEALAGHGLVESRQQQEDRRVRFWHVTEQGHHALAELPAFSDDGQPARALQTLSPTHREALSRQLALLVQGLVRPTGQGAARLVVDRGAPGAETPDAHFELWLRISRAYRLVRAGQTRFLLDATEGNVDTAAYMALYRVHETASSASEIASFLRVDQNTALRTIDRLEAISLISRDRNPTDRRQVLIAPTPRGLALLGAVPPFDPSGTYMEVIRKLPAAGGELGDALEALLLAIAGSPVVNPTGLDAFLERLTHRPDGEAAPALADGKLGTALAQLPTGFAVVTVDDRDGPLAILPSSLSPLSLVPPVLLVSIARDSSGLDRLLETRAFAANVLATEQRELAARFAQAGGEGLALDLGDESWSDLDGVPVLDGSLASIACNVDETFDAGSHVLLLASPRGLRVSDAPTAVPLVAWRSKLGRVDPVR